MLRAPTWYLSLLLRLLAAMNSILVQSEAR